MAQTQTTSLFNEAQLRQHIGFIFDPVQFEPGQFVCLRGIGEKDTPKEGSFREEFFFQPSVEPNWKDKAVEHCRRWGQHQVASFIVPCVLREPKATAANVSVFTTLVADFDNGNTDERMAWLSENIGTPDMVVESGGTTEEGTPKRHVWYRIEPTSDIEGVINVRHELASKAGADLMLGRGVESNPLGRSHQPVRLGGTIHGKNGLPKPCRIEYTAGLDTPCPTHVSVLSAISSAPETPWRAVAPKADNVILGLFGPQTTNAGDAKPVDLTTDVHAGGSVTTRFSEFNRVAGHYIHCARRGEMSLTEAYDALGGWVSAHMIPPWPENKVRSEWDALVRQDIIAKGSMSAHAQTTQTAQTASSQNGKLPINLLQEWAAHRWIIDPVPEHDVLVEGLVLKGEPHLFVGEGGSGKTFLLADLALKVAAMGLGDKFEWLGQKIKGGGTAVLILCEDSKVEMHRRIKQLDKGSLIKAAGDRLIVLPMTVLGGAFPLSERDFKTGAAVTSARWRQMLDMMKALAEPPVLVAIDTLNSVSHGDENSNIVISEMMREAHRVCGEMGAALVINHHIRKSNEPLRSLADLRNAIRGASAIPSYFRINFGMFSASDYERRMRAMGLTPKRGALWKFGVVKANIHGLLESERTLLRDGIGLLQDVTDKDPYAVVNISERIAWLVYAIKAAATALHPYGLGGKNAANGLYRRRAELPPMLRGVGWKEFASLIEEALQRGHIVPCAVCGSKAKNYLDVEGGELARDEAGVVILSGAYSNPPDWEDFYFDADSGEIIEVSVKHKWEDGFAGAKLEGTGQAPEAPEPDLFTPHGDVSVTPQDDADSDDDNPF